ncbi:MAG: SDR family oxidoreductase [Planctomycetota bacterium]|nr:MAG: SDR family oxidoreductase [Planctomycetota bacterium]
MTSQVPSRIVITGANRGIGLEFVQEYLQEGQRVFALCRHPESAPALAEQHKEHPDLLTVLPCDVTDDVSVHHAFDDVAAQVDGIEVLINNSGSYGRKGGTVADLDFREIEAVFGVNTLGPLRVTRAFLPLLGEGNNPKVVNITSIMGSIHDNGTGGSYAYRLSKAALNMATRNLALDLREQEIICVAVHPGWVKTDMGGPEAPLTVDDSVSNMLRLIDSLDAQHSGGFFNYRGRELPW